MSSEHHRLFEKAYTYLNNHNGQLANDQKLKLYGLYKQAIEGDCNTSRPSIFDLIGRSKWDAWHAAKGMSVQEAEEGYVRYVEELQLGWSRHGEQDKPDHAPPKFQGGSSGATMGKAVSKMSYNGEPDHDIEEGLFADVLENNITKVRERIKDQHECVNLQGEAGLTVLHHASDRGYIEMVKLLLDLGADINAKSMEDETALHYACISEQLETARLLIERGCDVNIRDASGSTAFQQADSSFLNRLGVDL